MMIKEAIIPILPITNNFLRSTLSTTNSATMVTSTLTTIPTEPKIDAASPKPAFSENS